MAPEINSPATREYHYSKYDDVHGENVEQSTIDKQDTKAKSIFDQKEKAWNEDYLMFVPDEKLNKLETNTQTGILAKAIQFFKDVTNKISISYSTESEAEASSANYYFEKKVDDAWYDLRIQTCELFDQACEKAENEINKENQNNDNKITVSNDRNKNGSINGSVEKTTDDAGNVTGLTVTSDKSGNSFTYKKEGDKFYQVDSQGNHIKDKSGNEKVYILDDNSNLVRDNSNVRTAARGTKPAKSHKPKVTVERNKTYKGNDTYYTRDNKYVDGVNTESTFRDKQGKLTAKDKFTNNSDGSYRNDTVYYNGAGGNRFTRNAVGRDNKPITDVNQAAKTAGLKPSSKFKGYYTDGNKVYRWDKGGKEFVMVVQSTIPKSQIIS